ncbi:MAG TPA: TadE family protein [Candidatus Acidoferrales bacterium]|nr:TadE family protein [Candidatus Acidoferrales bacterium]
MKRERAFIPGCGTFGGTSPVERRASGCERIGATRPNDRACDYAKRQIDSGGLTNMAYGGVFETNHSAGDTVPATAVRGQSPATRQRGEKGVEIIEFALAFAALMSLLLGIVALARAYSVYEGITRAAREGARMAALPSAVAASPSNSYMDPNSGSTSDTVFQSYIAPALTAEGLNPSSVVNYSESVGWLDPTDSQNQQCGVAISFQYPFTFYVPFTTTNLTTINIPTQVQMRRENQPAGSTCP